MTKADPIRNVRHAIRVLQPARPAGFGDRRLVRFVALLVASLLVIILAISVLAAIGAPKDIEIGVALAWIGMLCVGTPIVVLLRQRDMGRTRNLVGRWQSDPRRLSIERLGLDLQAGRFPSGMSTGDVIALDDAAGDWRQSRDLLDSLTWLRGDLAEIRNDLRVRLDDAMMNLLAEAGIGHTLGLAPFLLERARLLFGEVAVEASSMARSQAPTYALNTDASMEALRTELSRLRDYRIASEDANTDYSQTIPADKP